MALGMTWTRQVAPQDNVELAVVSGNLWSFFLAPKEILGHLVLGDFLEILGYLDTRV